MAEEAPVLIAGIDAIARALGVSSALVKSDLLRRPGLRVSEVDGTVTGDKNCRATDSSRGFSHECS